MFSALMFCFEFLLNNFEWLKGEIENQIKSEFIWNLLIIDYILIVETYFIFDCPGQVELYTHCRSFPDIITRMQKQFDGRVIIGKFNGNCNFFYGSLRLFTLWIVFYVRMLQRYYDRIAMLSLLCTSLYQLFLYR